MKFNSLMRKPMLVAWLLVLAATPFQPGVRAASPSLSLAKQLNEAFVEVAEKASPTVVVIEVVGKAEEIDPTSWLDAIPPELRKQFEEFFDRRKNTPRRRGPNRAPMGQGSGVVIREDGYILTNGHVVDGAEKITVRFKNGKEYVAKVQGIDTKSDIAVIKIDATGLPFAKLGDSAKTRVGEFVIAIGAPFALDYTVTVGHVSAKGRSDIFLAQELWNQDFIQTDASINPGNSGGPLVNLDGEVVGINTLIRGMNTGIGFAVPSRLAKQVADQLISSGKFTRAWLGIGIAALADSRELRQRVKGVDDGVVVTSVLRDGPAAKSGLELEDVIVAVDGEPVKTLQDLRNEVGGKKVGSEVTLDVVRDGRKMKVKVRPGELPADQLAVNRGPRIEAPAEGTTSFGLTVQTLTPALAKQFGVEASTGVVVTAVESGSAGEAAAIKPGEVVTRVNRVPVKSAKEFRDALKAGDAKKGISLSITGESGTRLEFLKDDGE